MDTRFDIDLDALTNDFKTAKLNDKVIKIYPPEFDEFLMLMKLSKQLNTLPKDVTIETLDDSLIIGIFENLKETLMKIAPELRGERISIKQTFALVQLISTMVTPPDTKEMEAKGITVEGSGEKKIDSSSSERLQNSFTSTEAIQSPA